MPKIPNPRLGRNLTAEIRRVGICALGVLLIGMGWGCSTPRGGDREGVRNEDLGGGRGDTSSANPFERWASDDKRSGGVFNSEIIDGVMHLRFEYCESGECYVERRVGKGPLTRVSGDPSIKQRYLTEEKARKLKSKREMREFRTGCEHHDIGACVRGRMADPSPDDLDRLKRLLCAEPGIHCSTLTYPGHPAPENFPGEKTLFTSSSDFDNTSGGEPSRPEREIFYVTSAE